MSTSTPHFFLSYSREDAALQGRIVAELRGRGINVWVDVEHLIPGSPAWEREIERSIRGAAGIIVLLSPDSNNSEWVRREISFAEQNEKRIFPVLIRGEEDDSIPLRLSSHQHVDLRRHFHNALDELANALLDHLGVTKVSQRKKPETKEPVPFAPPDLRKFALPALIGLIGLVCIGGLALAARYIYTAINNTPDQTATVTTPPDVQPTNPVATDTAIVIDTNVDKPTGKIVYTCQVKGDEVCIINADGSGWRQLTDLLSASYYASFSPDGESIVFIVKGTGFTEIYEIDLGSGERTQLTHLQK